MNHKIVKFNHWNKKGQFNATIKSMFWPLMMFIIVMFAMAFIIFLSAYRGQLSHTPEELHAELIMQRFINLPECFAYQDASSGRVLLGVIDINKFTKEQLDQCYLTPEKEGIKNYNFKFALEGEKKEVLTNNFFNDVDFTVFKEVAVKKGDVVTKDKLIIYVQVQI